jgi:uncharacterized membrane protein YbhN (UPF0104 family)
MMRRALVAFLGLCISIIAIALLALTVDVRATVSVLAEARWPPLIGAVVVIAMQLVVRSVRWQLLLPRPRIGTRVPLGRLIPILLVGYLGNSVLPARLGELMRAYLVATRERVPGAGALGSVLLERVMDVSTLAAIAFVAAGLAGAPDWIIQSTAIAAAIGLAALGLLVTGTLGIAARGIPAGRPRELVVSFAQSAGGQPRGVLVAGVALSCAAWALDATTFFLVGQSLALDVTFPSALLIGAVTVLSTAIPSAPGYIGTFELAAVTAGESLGLRADEALALALVAHAITSLPVAAAGATALAGMSLDLRGVARDAQAFRLIRRHQPRTRWPE